MAVTGSTTDLTVLPVDYKSNLGQFLAVPATVYEGDPNWIPPLKIQEKHRFTPSRPFFEHARWKGWVALRSGRPVGRITAQVDDLHLQRYEDATGYFGMLEAEDDPAVFKALFEVAENWLREQGVARVRGPYNLSVNEEIGLLVDGFQHPPYILMGHGRPYYDARVKDCGYSGAKDLLAYLVDTDFVVPAVMVKLVKRASRKVKVRNFRRADLEQESEVMRDIFNDAWQDNWGFVPFTKAEFLDSVKSLAALLPDDYIQIAEYEGEPAAFIVLLPNINEAISDLNGSLFPFGWLKALWRLKVKAPNTGRVPLMGVRKQFQGTPSGPVMVFMIIDAVRAAAVAAGMQKTEMGWILEDNQGMNNIIETIGGEAYKRYRMYEKELG